jgi:predicted TPR repeat methyltransferase
MSGEGSDPDQWLERVYSAPNTDALAATYDGWAATYDSDMLRIGYANPAVAAGLVGRWVADRDARLLEAGVGTGVLGDILSTLGYRSLAGVDISEGMLAKARARGAYAKLERAVLGETLGYESGTFRTIICFGVFTPGHAPAAALDELVRITATGGHLIFTVSTAAWRDCGFEAKLASLETAGRISLAESTAEYHPMPLSPTEAHFTTRGYVYEIL